VNFDVIITTYNRPEAVYNLVQSLLNCRPAPSSIIVVDSSELDDLQLQKLKGVEYIRSSHKNQPYQRYLGFLASREEIVCFFDDDIQIINPAIFEIILNRYSEKEIVGCNVNFINEGNITVQKELKSEWGINEMPQALSFLLLLTGVPTIKDGKAWLAGMRGNDVSNLFTETFSGPGGLSFRRRIVPSLFDDALFALFEKKMAMGEDKYISMGALRFGKLAHNIEPCIVHSENTSHYYQDSSSFTRKELYSRLWLSKRYLYVKYKWIGWAYIHYSWFAFWRILIAGIRCIIQPQKINFKIFHGKLLGVIDAVSKPYKNKAFCPEINWAAEFEKDLRNMKTRNQQS